MNKNRSSWLFPRCGLAVWWVAQLLAEKDGPRNVITRPRSWRGPGVPSRLMNCFYWLSLWVALPLAIWLTLGWIGLLNHWQALSGMACLLERTRLSSQRELRVVLDGNEISEGETSCGLVKSEAS